MERCFEMASGPPEVMESLACQEAVIQRRCRGVRKEARTAVLMTLVPAFVTEDT